MGIDSLADRLATRQARVGIIGLGHAGLPMAVAVAAAGFTVVGFDLDRRKLTALNDGRSPIPHIPSDEVAEFFGSGRFSATDDFSLLRELDAALICVQTPVTTERRADLGFVAAATATVAGYLDHGMLVVLQSTCTPGTTRTLLLPRLSAGGRQVGVDFFLACAPERVDPGNAQFTVRNTPRLVGGVTERCTEMASILLGAAVDVVVPVSSPEVAETAKLLENTYRFINISFINEMALLCDKIGVDVREVIDAASSKPFAFLSHFPSPGAGGHCIPVVPHFLDEAAQRYGIDLKSVAAAVDTNDRMPAEIVRKIGSALNEQGKAIPGSRILLAGITYKPNIASVEESAALRILGQLAEQGASVFYHDPLVPSVCVAGRTYTSGALTPALLADVDCAVILTAHDTIDLDLLTRHAGLVVDTRATAVLPGPPHVRNVWRPDDWVDPRT